jgi:signal transduction histidine kinase
MMAGPPAGGSTDTGADEERILVLTPMGRDADLAARALAAARLACTVCPDLRRAHQQLELGAGAILIADEALPLKDASQWDDWIPPEPPWSAIPIIVLTRSFGRGSHHSRQLRRLEARDNVSFLQRPVPKVTLISALRSAIASRRRQYVIRDFLEERKRSEEALIDADRRKDEFLAILAHELRNPLAPIVSSIEALSLSTHDPSLVRAACGVLERHVTHIVRLVDDLLDVSRITRNMITLQCERIDAADAVRRALDNCAGAAGARALSVDLGGVPLVVEGDFVRLVQVFSNILDNAIKYTASDGRIQVVAGKDGGQAYVAIADDGIGIAQGMLERIFEMFSRAEPGRVAGLGIGLTLVRQLVGLHHGSIRAQSEGLGKGSRFIVSLPLAEAAVAAAPVAPAEGPGRPTSGKRVLVVDDNVEAADTLGTLLGLLGAKVRAVYDGKAALEAFIAFRPQVVIVDLSMPGMDGYDVVRSLRRQPESGNSMLVALTGWSQPKVRARVLEAGFDRYLVKPIKAADLRDLLAAEPGPAGRT